MFMNSAYLAVYPYNKGEPIRWDHITQIEFKDHVRQAFWREGHWSLTLRTGRKRAAKIESDYFERSDWDAIFQSIHEFAPEDLAAEVPQCAPR